MRILNIALLILGAAVTFAACGDDDPQGGDGNDTDCSIGDPLDGDECECSGNECICPSSGDCGILCVDDCGLQCAGSGNCDFACLDGCNVDCTGSGNCDIDVGQGSTVSCTGSGDCDVTCEGDCTVDCPGSGTCIIRCAEGAECSFDRCEREAEDCGEGVMVCDGSCP